MSAEVAARTASDAPASKIFAPGERKSIWSQNARMYRSAAGARIAAASPIANAIMWIIGRPAVWLLRLETRLVSRDGKLSEYRTNLEAADVAGTRAMVDMHEHLRLRERFLGIVRQEARAGRDGLLSRVTAAVDGIPLESQPPDERIQLLEQRASTAAKVVLDSGRSEAIDRELEIRARSVEGDLYDSYRATLYR